MNKLLVFFLIVSLYLSIPVSFANAAFVTVSKDEKIIFNVLALQSDLKIKEVVDLPTPSANSQVSVINEGGKISLSLKNEEGEITRDVSEIADDLIEIEERPQVQKIKIAFDQGLFVIKNNNFDAKTAFPISVDSKSGKISVTTNSGIRYLDIFPSSAVSNAIKANEITKLKEDGDKYFKLSEDSKGQLEYIIPGEKEVNLFNLYTLPVAVDVTVSASSGQITKVDKPVWLRLLGFLFV